jgi:hypothetical protein
MEALAQLDRAPAFTGDGIKVEPTLKLRVYRGFQLII